MVDQYPHFLFVFVPGGDSYQDSNGNWVENPGEWILYSACREETNGAGRQINGVDGKARVFSSNVYMPKGTERILEGTQILVSQTDSQEGPLRVKGTILKFDLNTFNCRLWV